MGLFTKRCMLGCAWFALSLGGSLGMEMPIGAPFVYLEEGVERCFYLDLSPGTHVLVTYRMPSLNPSVRKAQYERGTASGSSGVKHDHPIGLKMTVKGQDGTAIEPPAMKGKTGLTKEVDSIGWMAAAGWGEYSMCFQTNTSHWTTSEHFELHLLIDTGTDAETIELEDMGHTLTTDVDQATRGLQKLKRRIDEIKTENEYFKIRDARFRWTSESTAYRVWVSAIVQVAILIACSSLQILYLKKFLRAKKLV